MSNQIWTVGMTIDDAEKNIIESALRFFQNNKSMTARSLGVSTRGLDGKIERLKIEVKKSSFKEIYDEDESSKSNRGRQSSSRVN